MNNKNLHTDNEQNENYETLWESFIKDASQSVKKARKKNVSETFRDQSDVHMRSSKLPSSSHHQRFRCQTDAHMRSSRPVSHMKHETEKAEKEIIIVSEDDFSINALKIIGIAFFIVFCCIFVPSGDKMSSKFDMLNNKDSTAIFESSASVLMSVGLSDVYNMPKYYVLPKSNEPAPLPDPTKFTKIYDDERKNSNGEMIDYYKDETIEVKCWQEIIPRVSDGMPLKYRFAEIWIQHPSQFRRKLVGDTISNKQVAYPWLIFQKTNGVVGMTSDYCAFRNFGTVIHFGEAKRINESSNDLDLMIYDSNGNLSWMKDSEFLKSELFGSDDVVFTFAFGPVLVDNYEMKYEYKKFMKYPIGEFWGEYPRAAIGQYGYDKHYLLCTLDYTAYGTYKNFGGTGQDITTAMYDKGVRFAYNLDGGQTSTMLFNNRVINDVAYGGHREVSDVIYFATAIPNDN